MFETCASAEDVKAEVRLTFFKKFAIERNRRYFAVKNLFWAEAEKAPADMHEMLARLLLAIKPRIDDGDFPPKFLGCFDTRKIAFVEYRHVHEIFSLADFNWNEKPSSVTKKTVNAVKRIVSGNDAITGKSKLLACRFDADADILRDFIELNFQIDAASPHRARVSSHNFTAVFRKWLEHVLPGIAAPFDVLERNGIVEGDFFLADVFSEEGEALSGKLKVWADNDKYRLAAGVRDGLFTISEIHFRDGKKAHADFWSGYECPPKRECRDHILQRRDLLVPKHSRERKGAFFTPDIWARKSRERLAGVFGDEWEDEYFIWDCCCGTGNLEAGLSNPGNVWCSTIDDSDIDAVKSGIASKRMNLLESHVFRFDFLNDEFSALPEELLDIVNTAEKQRKLIMYMNPPYAEGGNNDKRGKGKKGVNISRIQKAYANSIGRANQELFAQFMARIHAEIPLATLAAFGTLKYVNSPNFAAFRDFFRAEYKGGFIVRANTFDNVKGDFPIGFLVWNQRRREPIAAMEVDVLDDAGTVAGVKKLTPPGEGTEFLNDWLRGFDGTGDRIGYLSFIGNDFQQQDVCFIMTEDRGHHTRPITKNNLDDMAVYFAARHCIPHTWLNHNDQFLHPCPRYRRDREFLDDCLMFTIFHHKNSVRSANGTNPWIPFNAGQVGAKHDFRDDFMHAFIKDRRWSESAGTAYDAGLELWKRYHAAIWIDSSAPLNASLYEIREYFRGRSDSGKLRRKAADEGFNALDAALKASISGLAEKISGKIYEYGFLA